MELRTVSAQALIEWNKWFSAWNNYVDYSHIKLMKNFCHRVDEEQDGSSEDEETEEQSEEE